MIFRKATLIATVLLVGLGFSMQATDAAELNDGYLLGTWVVDSTDCADQTAELVIFRDNGAVESVRAGKLEAAGFWMLDGDVVKAHLIASPAFFHDAKEGFGDLATFADGFSAFPIRVIPLNLEDNKFDGVGLLGDQVAVGVFQRCGS